MRNSTCSNPTLTHDKPINRMTEEASKPNGSSYVLFVVQAVVLIMLAVIILGYIYIQEDRLKELERKMATMTKSVKGNNQAVIEVTQTLLKISEELESVYNRLGIIQVVVSESLNRNEELMSIQDKTPKQLDEINEESQSKGQIFKKIENDLEKIGDELQSTDQMLHKLKDSLAEVSDRDKSVISARHHLQAHLDKIMIEMQTYAKTFSQIESDLKKLSEQTAWIKSAQSNATHSLEETRKDLHERIRSHDEILDEHVKAIDIAKGSIQNSQQRIAASDTCQTGVVAMDRAISGDDERLLQVQFGSPFSTLPVISYGIVKLNTAQASDSRIWVSLKDQSTTGFTVSFATWLGSCVFECIISWMACNRS